MLWYSQALLPPPPPQSPASLVDGSHRASYLVAGAPGEATVTRRRSIGRGDSKGSGSDVTWDSSTNNNTNNNTKKSTVSNRRPNTRATSRRSSAEGGSLKQRTGAGVGGGKAVASGRASGRSGGGGGGDVGVSVVASAGMGGAGEGDEAKLTRAEWQSLQADETISFALSYVKRRVNDDNGTADRQQQVAPLCEKPGDREAVVAALAVLKAAHHATSFAEQAASVARGGTGKDRNGAAVQAVGRGSPAATVRFAEDEEALLDWDSQRDVRDMGLNPADCYAPPGRGSRGQRGRDGVREGLEMVAGLLLVFARGYQHLTQFRCREVRKK